MSFTDRTYQICALRAYLQDKIHENEIITDADLKDAFIFIDYKEEEAVRCSYVIYENAWKDGKITTLQFNQHVFIAIVIALSKSNKGE
jgi:hypothetical protein